MSLLGNYVKRVSNASKDLQKYPIVFACDTVHQKFQAYKTKMTQEFGIVSPQKTGPLDENVGSPYHICSTECINILRS